MKLLRKRSKGPGIYLIFFYKYAPPVREVEDINVEKHAGMSDLGTPLNLP